MNLEITEKDTTPIQCKYAESINGYTFLLNAFCFETNTTISIGSTLVDELEGTFNFERAETDFTAGSYEATIQTTYPDSSVVTSERFIINVAPRII